MKRDGGIGYTIGLHFGETTFDAVEKHKFNVEINGKQILSEFDVFPRSRKQGYRHG